MCSILQVCNLATFWPFSTISGVFSKISYLGNGEKASPGDEDQGHGVEPASDVGENPQRKTEPESVKIFWNK